MTNLKMVLAQAPWAEEGDLNDHLEMRVELNAQGRLDQAAFASAPGAWTATRRQPGQPAKTARLVWVDQTWALRGATGDDEPLWDGQADILRPGEVVGLRQPDGATLWFRIVLVEADADESIFE